MGEGSEAEYLGRYGSSGSPGLIVERGDAGLVLRLPGAPRDAVTVLHATDTPDRFVLGATSSGAFVQFTRAGDSVTALSLAGGLRFGRHPDREPPDYVAVAQPSFAAEELAAFEALFARALAAAGGGSIDYDLPQPRHRFLAWLCMHKQLLAHGSNTADIASFEPRRKTLGMLPEQSESGVSACADGLWAMAYAVLDRARMRGSFQNAAIPFASPSGAGRLYHFSIPHEIAAQTPSPFRDGVVYLFAREGFSQLRALGAQLEWRADRSVRPLAWLAVGPDDFPLLGGFRSHDDRAALRFVELFDGLLRECSRADTLADGVALCFVPRPRLMQDVLELLAILRRAYPWIDLALHAPPAPSELVLTLRGSRGLRDVVGEKLRDQAQRD